jgi:hypothetical protein
MYPFRLSKAPLMHPNMSLTAPGTCSQYQVLFLFLGVPVDPPFFRPDLLLLT